MDYGDDDLGRPRWGVISPRNGGDMNLVREALRKEQIIKEIVASQEDLKAMLAKVQTTQKQVDKLASENETLQMYIDNLTVQMRKTTLI